VSSLYNGKSEETRSGGDHQLDHKLLVLFKAMGECGASDLHIKQGLTPHMRVNSELRSLKIDPMSADDMINICNSLLSEEQLLNFKQEGGIDKAYELEGSDRFRINIFRQRGEISLVARRITRNIPSFDQLNLPEEVSNLVNCHQGLILLAGPTGSGKSSTIASMLDFINAHNRFHIVTIEDPIEFLYESKKSLVNQIEVGIDVPNFDLALRAVLREDPDIVLIGEMRDRETFETALRAAETGHLVFGTIHAGSAAQTITRILDLFEAENHNQILQGLSHNLLAVICQKLLPSVLENVRRVPAVEVMRTNPTVRELLSKNEVTKLKDLVGASHGEGMISFTKSLFNLIEKDMISPKVGMEAAPNREELQMMLKGISQSRRGLIG